MPMYDYQCPACQKIEEHLVRVGTDLWECECGAEMTRIWTGHATSVIPDGIPGGLMIKNGLCNPDGTPKRYDSYSEIRRAEKRTGMVNHVEHKPPPGTDKSKFTTKWN